jgi:aspartate carbamoyltransferase catalytic subunit
MAKGESIQDIAEMFNNYGDVIVLRNNEDRSVYDMLDALRIPIVNAGNGIDEHPTQAMADVYTIFKWRPELLDPDLPRDKRIRVGIIGVPNRMRTVRSLLLLLARFPTAIEEVVIFTDQDSPFDEGQAEELNQAGLSVRVSKRLEPELPDLDVVYINAIAWVGDSYEQMGAELKLSTQSPLKKDSIILHPLARGEELDTDLDPTLHNWYFAQARGAVFVRMALLTCMVRRVSEVMDT